MRKYLDPQTENAERFCNLYGCRFDILQAVGDTVQMISQLTEKIITVRNGPRGIYVDGKLFCEAW